MIIVTAHNHWLSIQEENDKNIQSLKSITAFLIKKMPDSSFSEIVARQGASNKSYQEQLLAINQELQPILNDIPLPAGDIKFGFYSRQHGNMVAVGPTFDTSMLIDRDHSQFRDVYECKEEQLFKKKNALIWPGANILIYVRPIEKNGVIIGHVFASVNQDTVISAIWRRTANNFFGVFFILLVCTVIFRELIAKLKKDFQLFAEAILDGRTCKFNSEVEEFSPILQYISEQTEKMTRLDRLNIIGEMAAGIAHEVRNPMTTVRGLLQLMSRKLEFNHHKDKFNLMIDEIDRANNIISEFLSLAKNKTMNFTESNLNDILSDLYPLLQADTLRNNCQIEMSLNHVPTIYLDQSSIRQLILNMILNGIDAMPTGGLIKINTQTVGEKVLLSIEDNGIGISIEHIEILGTPFFTTKDKGTGLGLAVCYRIVQRHKAVLTVESEVGKGTVFTITFNSNQTDF